jgi:hypothetical protein
VGQSVAGVGIGELEPGIFSTLKKFSNLMILGAIVFFVLFLINIKKQAVHFKRILKKTKKKKIRCSL